MENCLVQPNTPNVVSELFDDEIILVNLINGNYYSLRHSAAEIWQLIAQKRSLEEILGAVTRMYPEDEVDGASVQSFITELVDQQLIKTGSVNGYAGQSLDIAVKAAGSFQAPLLETYSDMQDLLLLDPIHDVDEESGWPTKPPEDS